MQVVQTTSRHGMGEGRDNHIEGCGGQQASESEESAEETHGQSFNDGAQRREAEGGDRSSSAFACRKLPGTGAAEPAGDGRGRDSEACACAVLLVACRTAAPMSSGAKRPDR